MKHTFAGRAAALIVLAILACGLLSWVAAPAMAAAAPDLTKAPPADVSKPYNLGPTGAMGWMHVEGGMTEQARQILVTVVEKGSPADGVLKVGDVILGTFGKLFDRDARKSFGFAIGQAETEASKGVLKLIVWRQGRQQDIDLKLKVMGAYSDTSPYDCPKAKKILEDGCRYIAKNPTAGDSFHINMLALMASGDGRYMEIVKKTALASASGVPDPETLWKSAAQGGMKTWGFGYNNLFLTEYYLLTGDKAVLPAIRSYTASLSRGQGKFGTWGHGLRNINPPGQLHGPVPPYGPVNQAGLPGFVSLALAVKCGIKDPELEPALARADKFFGYYVGKGTVPYGEHRPGIGHDDNGKTSITAMAFSVQGRQAETKFFAKMVTASYESREWGHAGSAFSYVWGPSGANCGGPKAAAAFMKELRWYYDLARRWDGSFVFTGAGGGGGGCSASYHGVFNATGSFLLAYALPLRKIYMTGRDQDKSCWLNDADAAEAVEAERRLGGDAYAKRTTQRLLAGLGNWSPAVRFWSAQELGKRQDDILPQLMAMVKGDKPEAKLGAINALGQLKKRGVPALDTLAALLHDDDRWVRVQAAEALRTIGQDAKPVLPQMLKAVAVKDESDQMEFGAGALAYALFYPGGSYGPKGILAGSINEIPKETLYPAIRVVAANPDSHARGCLRSTYALLTLDDVKALAPTILATVEDMPPANTMFSKGVRLAGIQAMARLHIQEGIPLSIMLINLPEWGKAAITSVALDVLKQYGGSARSALPELRKLEQEYIARKQANERKKIADVIAAIENDKNPPKLISLKDYLGNGAKK